MLTLALDTTTQTGSCAVAHDGIVLHEFVGDGSKSHGTRLPGDLMSLLDRAGISLKVVDIYAVAIGPGSFTGIRVGIATMQGLAFAASKPLIGVSGLDALATIAELKEHEPRKEKPLVATWVDAWRGEVYAALYENGSAIRPPVVASPDCLLPALQGIPTLFIGDGAQVNRDIIGSGLGGLARFAHPLTPTLAGTIAKLATDMARAGHTPPPHAISPLYVRRSDADLARDARPAH